jgi:hypothetical protein
MRTVFFPDGAPECPLIAITDFEASEIIELQHRIGDLATGKAAEISLEGEVRLVLRRGQRDIGISESRGPIFSCVLRPLVWEGIVEWLEPFKQTPNGGWQWLDTTGVVSLLISKDGTW